MFEKEITDPENPFGAKIYHDGCADRWEKDETYRQQMSHRGQLESWDTMNMQRTTNHISCVDKFSQWLERSLEGVGRLFSRNVAHNGVHP